MLEHTRKKRQETEEETDTFLECEQNSSNIIIRKLILEALSPCQFCTLLRDFIRSNLSSIKTDLLFYFLF